MGQRMIRHVDSRRMETLRRLYEGGGSLRHGGYLHTRTPGKSNTLGVHVFLGEGKRGTGGLRVD